jgi:hypothetical protein
VLPAGYYNNAGEVRRTLNEMRQVGLIRINEGEILAITENGIVEVRKKVNGVPRDAEIRRLVEPMIAGKLRKEEIEFLDESTALFHSKQRSFEHFIRFLKGKSPELLFLMVEAVLKSTQTA